MKKFYFLSFLFLLLSFSLIAQTGNTNYLIDKELLPKRFIENKGQFDGRIWGSNEKVLYAVDHGATQIFFTEKGVVYRIDDKQKNFYRKTGDKKSPRLFMETVFFEVAFQNASSNLKLVGKEKSEDYHTYSVLNADKSTYELNQLKGYKKLVYENIYPNIDLEYVFHEEEGLKYAFTLKPGANPDDIKMHFKSEKDINIDSNGNIIIKTLLGDIVDHAPHSFYQKNNKKTIATQFKLDVDNIVSFDLANYDASKTVIIDPWTVTPSVGNSNKVWNIGTDFNNNVYIYGGDSPLRLIKYDAIGNLQWTYTTPWDTGTYWTGTMINDTVGNAYITAGTRGRIRKISPAGVLQWENIGGSAFGVELEYWNLALNCDETQLFCGGMRSPSGINVNSYRGAIFELSLVNGSLQGFEIVGNQEPGPLPGSIKIKEVRALCSAPNNNYYYMTLDSVGGIRPNLNVDYQISSGYNFTYGLPAYGVTNQGINAMVADKDFLYTINATTLDKRNLNTGAILSSVPIPGGINNNVPLFNDRTIGNGGIALDSCGNLYVGSSNAIYKFDNNLNQLASASTPGAVYDVAINNNGEVVACGNGFVISVDLQSCEKPRGICLQCLELTPQAPLCQNDGSVNLIANLPGGTWSGPGITDANLGTFDPSVAGIGDHFVTYDLPSALCGMDSMQITVSPCLPLEICIDTAGSIRVLNGTGSYIWEQEILTQDCSNCFVGCNLPPNCAINVLTWSNIGTGSTIAAPTSFPIRVTDNIGTQLVINDLVGVPACDSIACPTISLTVSNVNGVSCGNEEDGTANISSTGGFGNMTYLWQPGNLTGANQNNLAAGTYTVTATDVNGCSADTTIIIQGADPIDINLNVTQPDCGENNGQIQATVTGGTGTLNYNWSNNTSSPNLSNLGAGIYTLIVTDTEGCQDSVSVNLSSPNAPTVNIVLANPASCFGGENGASIINVSGGAGGYTYNWSPSGATIQNPFTLQGGINHTVTVTDQDGCSGVAEVFIGQPDAINSISNVQAADCGSSNGAITLSANGGAGGFTYEWSDGTTGANINNIIPGEYIVTVTDANNCSQNDTIVVPQIGNLNVIANPNSATIEPGDEVAINVTGGTSYTWTPAEGLNCTTCASVIASPSATTTYIVGGVDDFGCTGADTVTIIVERPCGEVFVPTIFSPNNDGENDLQCVFGNCISTMTFGIYNRWGELLFESNNQSQCWDGTQNGEPVSTGVYFYRLNVLTTEGVEETISGNFNLVR